jgi:exonuclease SbcC
MRLLRLDIEGFGTFRDTVSLDFSDTDYFVLVGPTGSGKTTVIDAISFALYGAAPRWPRKNQVSLVMAPSTSHTRVCLIFEVGGQRYAAVRALAKSARGQVTTKQSRLITLPVELDLAGELGDVLAAEAEALADAPGDMQDAVEHLLGLKYEHFMQSVVLPQGGFAQFLHADKRERQDLLVSLLGLGVYEQVMKRANALADQAHTRAATLDSELLKYADATDDAQHAATHELSQLRDFQQALPDLLAPWKAAAAELETATELSSAHESGLQALAAVRPPVDLDTLAQQRADATAASTEAAGRVAETEQHEADTEQASQTAGKPSDWQHLIALHEQLATALQQQEAAVAAVTKTTEEADAAQMERDRRQYELDNARTGLDNARTAHAADHLASGLEPGAECPVCRQIVTEVPQRPPHPEIDEAQSRVDAADQNLVTGEQTRQTAQRASDRAVDVRDRLAQQVADLQDQLKDQPDAETAATACESAKLAETAAATARQAARDAREAQRKADETSRSLEQQWVEAGRQLSAVRDTVAHLFPPVSTGEHAHDWTTLAKWAESKHAELSEQVKDAVARRDTAAATELQQRNRMIAELESHQITAPEEFTETAAVTAVTTAVNAAQYKLDRITERRTEAAQLAEDITAHRRSEELDKELGNLLSARNFERWIVEEALQAMMIEASATLSELSGGQFELTTDVKQDIYVIDHNDASSQRPVQTLSGGETFQASLALALALSSQIMALSASTGRLDTLLLDEGFGTLDPATLDVVAGTLEQLAGGGERTVGLVTHVAALAERIPVRFEVRREGTRSRVEKVTA